MTKKTPIEQDLPQPPADEGAPAEETRSPSLLERVIQRDMEETIERARGELRIRRQLETTILGVDPDAGPDERARARRELARTLGLEPDAAPAPDEEPLSLVERVAWRVEQEAIDRGSDEFRARRDLARALGLEPEPSPEDLEERKENEPAP